MMLITGAQGKVGAELLRLLQAQGLKVRSTQRTATTPVDGEAVRFDFTEGSTWPDALEGVEALFLTRPPAIAQVERDLFPFLQAAEASGVRRVVFLSIQGAEALPWLPHRRIEAHLERSLMDWTFLRPSFFMQNLSTTHRAEIQLRDELYLPAGDGLTSFVDARDVAQVAAQCLSQEGHAGQAYTLTGPESLGYEEVASIFTKHLGRPIHYTDAWLLGFVVRHLAEGQALDQVLVLAGIYTSVRMGVASGYSPDLERLLGHMPGVLNDFVEGHKSLWERSPAPLA